MVTTGLPYRFCPFPRNSDAPMRRGFHRRGPQSTSSYECQQWATVWIRPCRCQFYIPINLYRGPIFNLSIGPLKPFLGPKFAQNNTWRHTCAKDTSSWCLRIDVCLDPNRLIMYTRLPFSTSFPFLHIAIAYENGEYAFACVPEYVRPSPHAFFEQNV